MSTDRQACHQRKAAAIVARISESGIRVPTEGEIAAKIRRARESGNGLTVEQAAMDASAVLRWLRDWDSDAE